MSTTTREWAEKILRALHSVKLAGTEVETVERELEDFRKEVLLNAAGEFRKQRGQITNWAARQLQRMAGE